MLLGPDLQVVSNFTDSVILTFSSAGDLYENLKFQEQLIEKAHLLKNSPAESEIPMSAFGGDSWAREAQYRKRRVDDLIIEGIDASVYKKLFNGRFACLVCPNNPILDKPTVLLAHVNGSRHGVTESKRKEKELAIQEEVQKRIALSDRRNSDITGSAPIKQRKIPRKSLIEQTRKAAYEVLSSSDLVKTEVKSEANSSVMRRGNIDSSHKMEAKLEGVVGDVVSASMDYRARLERELKFTAAGWKRDGYGKWFKGESAEFDSDEEDPNIVFNGTA